MKPSEYLQLDRYEKAFILASINIKVEEEKKRESESRRRRKR